jgi:hypothetical protein
MNFNYFNLIYFDILIFFFFILFIDLIEYYFLILEIFKL